MIATRASAIVAAGSGRVIHAGESTDGGWGAEPAATCKKIPEIKNHGFCERTNFGSSVIDGPKRDLKHLRFVIYDR